MPLSNKNVQSLKKELVNFIQNRQFKKAEKLYPRYKNQNIQDVDIWRYFAGIHSERGNQDELIACCRKILEITPEDSVTTYNLGACLQNQNRIDLAIVEYEKCIALDPNHINAISNCANLHLLTGNAEKAALYFRITLEKNGMPEVRIRYGEALMRSGDKENALIQFKYLYDTDPNNKKALFLIAQCYYELQHYREAEKNYLELLQTDKSNINAINNLGRVYEEAGQTEKAIDYFKQAISVNNKVATIHINLGKNLLKAGLLDSARDAFDTALHLEPENPEIFFNIGKIHNETGDSTKAKECFSKALELNVEKYLEKPVEFILAVKYFLSNLENPEFFNEDKQAFVADLFDGYADKFDKHLVDGLNYRIPELIDELIIEHVKKNDNNTLDLGCGTGLCGKYLKKVSKDLTGVDLSAKMIEKAKLLNCYDQLITGEITEVIQDLNTTFELIIAADVFVYIGSLSDIFSACSKSLSQGGYFIFSCEGLAEKSDGEFRLYDSGRYKHSTEYIDKLTVANGFELVSHQYCVVRKEHGHDAKGYVTTLIKK